MPGKAPEQHSQSAPFLRQAEAEQKTSEPIATVVAPATEGNERQAAPGADSMNKWMNKILSRGPGGRSPPPGGLSGNRSPQARSPGPPPLHAVGVDGGMARSQLSPRQRASAPLLPATGMPLESVQETHSITEDDMARRLQAMSRATNAYSPTSSPEKLQEEAGRRSPAAPFAAQPDFSRVDRTQDHPNRGAASSYLLKSSS